ncbi:hypothetical protein [Oerskovia merdavium]|uniref:Uncharacterized protein n=1 Tax=Oerskovia merdavium TaxID=2762227 RepID=A0ABR8U0M5_9CELL|nr:hypothetical protein [Oerskovia merdavium]MBD7981586.1 hypothetical protein [Oerskovia merdavium]
MPMTSRREPAVLAAGLLTSVLWVGSALLSRSADAPFEGQTVLAGLLAGAVVVAVTYLATRRLPRGTGTWALLLGTWFGVVVGGAAGAVADVVADVTFPSPDNPAFLLLTASFDGSSWGLSAGWLVGLVVVGTLSLTSRRDASALPATRRARKPLRARTYPTALVAGGVGALVWAGVGAAGSWLVWHRSARGPVDLLAEVTSGAMAWRFTTGRPVVEPLEMGLGVLVGLVVAGGTWLATRRLPPRASRWSLVLAVWFVAIAGGAGAPPATRSVMAFAVGELRSTTVNLALSSVQASLFWPLVLGWSAGLLAALVYRATGGEPAADAGSTTPDDLSRSALHTDAEEPVTVP